MSPALLSRRAAAVAVATAIGLSTAVLSAPGVASALPAAAWDIDSAEFPDPAVNMPVPVPATVCAVTWELTGAAGGDSASFDGGVGDVVTVTTSVAPGSTLLVQPGRRGGSSASGGAGGTSGSAPSGGAGGAGAAGGGGASIVRAGTSGTSPVLVLAAGGGGAGTSADGGNAGTAGGAYDDLAGGGGASPVAPGGVPDGAPGAPGNGTWLVGGAGDPGAGGGGGGLYGGGSGASDGTDGSGGGGGSSPVPLEESNEPHDDPDPTIGPAPATELDGSVRGRWVPCVAPFGPHGFHGDGTAGDGTLSVVWRDGTNSAGSRRAAAVTDWELSLDDGATWTIPATASVALHEAGGSGPHPALRATVSGLTNGQTYAVRVRPTSAAGPGEEIAETLLLTPRGPVVVPDADVVPPAPVAPAPTAPSSVPSSVPSSDGPLAGPDSLTRGGTTTLSGSGYLPGSTVNLYVYSTPRLLGSATADASGSFSATVTLPADLAAGRHHLVAAGVDASGQPYYLVQQVSVAGSGSVLALTGFEPLPWLAGSGALLLAGTVLLLLGRRRTT